jgi:hypothetical protein
MAKREKAYRLNICLIGIFALALLAACATDGAADGGQELSLRQAIEESAEKTAGELPKGCLAAIVSFESANSGLSEFIMEELYGALKDRGIGLVDRQNLKHVLAELNFQMSGNVSDESARSIGKFLGADVVITGQIAAFGDMYRFRTSAINVETAACVSITRFDVRNDRTMRQAGGK